MKLNRNQIKYIAIAAMLIDHIAYAFVPLNTVLGQAMHFIGRFTGPVMMYFICEGYIHTGNRKKYALRLGAFALISWIPFCSFAEGKWCIKPEFGVIYTYFLAVLAIMYYEKHEGNISFFDEIVLIAIISLSGFGDWACFGVMWPLLLFAFRNDKEKQRRWSWVMCISVIASDINLLNPLLSIFNLGCIVPCFVIDKFYSGKPGRKTALNKWFFYIFYPLHLLLIVVLKVYVYA